MREFLKGCIVIIAMVAILGCTFLFVTSNATIHVSKESTENCRGRKCKTMGVDVYIHLFNLKTYKEKVFPAYQAFLKKDEPEALITLLRECIQKLDANPQLSKKLLWDKESCEEDIGILKGTVYYSLDGGLSSNQGKRKKTHTIRREYAQELLIFRLLQILCMPYDKGVNPEQDMSNTLLVDYLSDRSEWIKKLLIGEQQVEGGLLELPLGEASELFTKQDLKVFSYELAKVPSPEEPQLRNEYDNLRALVKLALEDPDLTLVLSVG
jgi:hypothetical protein